MTLVDPCGLGKEYTCNVTSGSMWFRKRTHMQMAQVDPCCLGKEHACNVTSGSVWFRKRTHMQCHQWINVVLERTHMQ